MVPKYLPKDATWAAAFDRLLAHVSAGGSLTTAPADDEEAALMHFVAANMRAYHQGTLSAVKARLLETVPGWAWSLSDVPDDPWPFRYKQLARFVAKHNRFPFRFHPKERDLGTWVEEQRDQAHLLQVDRVTALEKIPGWSWAPPSHEDAAIGRYLRAMERLGRHPRNYHQSPDERALYAWAKKLRSQYGRGELTAEQVTALEAIPGWSWDGPPR